MKKILVPAFFVLSLLLTIFVTTSVIALTIKDGEVEFKTLRHRLSDTEVNYANVNKLYTSKLEIKEDYTNIRYDEVKITRNKIGLSWVEKVDTLKSYVQNVSDFED